MWMLPLSIAALAAGEHDDLANQLQERKEQCQEHLKRARSKLVGDNNEEAAQAFTDAIELTVARSTADALRLVISNRWNESMAPRIELADMYTGRGLARLRLQSWAGALEDAHAANFLAAGRNGGGRYALSLLAATSAGLCSLPQEPVSFFDNAGEEAANGEMPPHLAVTMTEQLCHGLVADVYSMLTDGVEVGSTEHKEAVAARDRHVVKSHGALHPLAARGGMTSAEAFTLISMAVESLAAEPFNTQTNTSKVVLLAQTLISVTAFRLGCRESPLQWRPKHLLGHLNVDRVVELWLRSRVEGEAGPTLHVGQQVRLTGLSTRLDLNGQIGKVASYDKIKDRYKVTVAEERLGLKARNLIAEVTGSQDGKSEL